MSLYIGKDNSGTPIMHTTKGEHDASELRDEVLSDTVFHSGLDYLRIIKTVDLGTNTPPLTYDYASIYESVFNIPSDVAELMKTHLYIIRSDFQIRRWHNSNGPISYTGTGIPNFPLVDYSVNAGSADTEGNARQIYVWDSGHIQYTFGDKFSPNGLIPSTTLKVLQNIKYGTGSIVTGAYPESYNVDSDTVRLPLPILGLKLYITDILIDSNADITLNTTSVGSGEIEINKDKFTIGNVDIKNISYLHYVGDHSISNSASWKQEYIQGNDINDNPVLFVNGEYQLPNNYYEFDLSTESMLNSVDDTIMLASGYPLLKASVRYPYTPLEVVLTGGKYRTLFNFESRVGDDYLSSYNDIARLAGSAGVSLFQVVNTDPSKVVGWDIDMKNKLISSILSTGETVKMFDSGAEYKKMAMQYPSTIIIPLPAINIAYTVSDDTYSYPEQTFYIADLPSSITVEPKFTFSSLNPIDTTNDKFYYVDLRGGNIFLTVNLGTLVIMFYYVTVGDTVKVYMRVPETNDTFGLTAYSSVYHNIATDKDFNFLSLLKISLIVF